MEKEFIGMARACSSEIKALRAQIDRLKPKAEAYDNMAAILNLLPRPNFPMSEDLAWKLDRRIEELSQKAAETGDGK